MIQTDYLLPVFDANERRTLITQISAILSPIDNPHDYTLVGCGLSGVMLLPLLSHETGINCTIVRKKSDRRHSKWIVEGYTEFSRYIIIDDLIESGKTIKYIKKNINLAGANLPAKMEGIILYNQKAIGECDMLAAEFKCWVKSVGSEKKPFSYWTTNAN